jgi:hypothetical protein
MPLEILKTITCGQCYKTFWHMTGFTLQAKGHYGQFFHSSLIFLRKAVAEWNTIVHKNKY